MEDTPSGAGGKKQSFMVTGGAGRGEKIRVPKQSSRYFSSQALVRLEHRGITTLDLSLPGGGILRSHIGIEEPAWISSAPAVAFRVLFEERPTGQRRLLGEKILDPYRNEGDRGWVLFEVPLPDPGEESFRLVFETLPAVAAPDHPSLPVWGDPTILRPERRSWKPLRVVLISLDTLRARSMSAYGYESPTTPRLDRLLPRGTLFENAFTTFSNTLGSHMSMMTGLYPASHGVLKRSMKLGDAIPTLAARMRDSGYETAAFTENALLKADAGFEKGFGHYFENKGLFEGAGDAEGTFERALDWVAARPNTPFFLFVHTYEVHYPYAPLEEPLPFQQALRMANASPPGFGDGERNAYEREVLHLDRLLAEFLEGLRDQTSEPENTLVVITSDHGEEFGEHGGLRHIQMFDEVMQIPLFLRWPGRVPGGLRVAAPVSLVDIVPTVLELAGLPTIAVDGTSLVPLMEGKEIDREVVFGQSAGPNRPGFPRMAERFVARSLTGKCLVGHDPSDQQGECYDLVADPEELHPVDSPGPTLQSLRAAAIAYREDALRASGESGRADALESGVEHDPARERKLRALGYID